MAESVRLNGTGSKDYSWVHRIGDYPLAVPFWSVEYQDNYMSRLFAPEATTEEVIVERTPKEILTTAPVTEVRTARVSTRRRGRKRAA